MFRRRPTLPDALELAGRSVPVVATRRSAARCVRLKANPIAGCIELTLPSRGGTEAAAALLTAHQDWLAARVAGWPQPQPLTPGRSFLLDGCTVRIDWQAALPRTPRLLGEVVMLGGPVQNVAARIERWLKARARAELTATTLALAATLGRPVERVVIGDAASRWGSCAGSNRAQGARIAYSWRLILAPDFVRQSVVAHEVAHLIHPNHSPAFHALNRQLDPHAAEARRWLARHGAALHWVGREA